MVAALLAGGLTGPGAQAAGAAPAAGATDLVNPFVGTQNFGNTFPGASAPFGMVQVSPDTLALMAEGLGHRADASMLAARGQWYRNLWDSSIGQFRPRTTQGTWVTPYDPVEAGHQFHEGGAHQYQWLVPQDPAGLVGGRLPVQTTVPLAVTVPAGTAVGSYPVRVTVSAEGMQAVVRTATVEVRAAANCAGSGKDECAVDLAGAVNHDGTATKDRSGEGNFDGMGWSYDADLLPKAGAVAFNGVTYHAPDPSGTVPNFIEARGQALLLPAAARSSLHLVAASHNGPVATTVSVRYADGSSADVPVTIGDWAGSTPSGSTVVLDMPHRIKDGQGVDGPSVRLFGDTARLDGTKTVRSLTLPDDPRVEVYAITLR